MKPSVGWLCVQFVWDLWLNQQLPLFYSISVVWGNFQGVKSTRFTRKGLQSRSMTARLFTKRAKVMFSRFKKADTSWDPVCENKSTYFLLRETIWGCAQWKRTCSHPGLHHHPHRKVASRGRGGISNCCLKRRVWTRSLKQATLQMTSLEGQEACIWEG